MKHRRRALVVGGAVVAMFAVVAVGAGLRQRPSIRPLTMIRPPVVAAVTATPTVAPMALTMPRSLPVRVIIPSIGVSSALMPLGLLSNGTMAVPPDWSRAGWYTGAPTPGELGPAVLAAHVDWRGHPGVFYRLRDVRTGSDITVVRADGRTAVFRVTRVARFSKAAFPTALVYGNLAVAGLRLITCGGSFDRAARSYRDNIVVFAELASTGSLKTADPLAR